MSRRNEGSNPSGPRQDSAHLRSPSRPEIDLSSKNVFAFGLQSSYGGFSNEEQRRRFPQLVRNGTDQPRGSSRGGVSWSTVARRGAGDSGSSKPQKKRAPGRGHLGHPKSEKDREVFYDTSRSESGSGSRSRSPSPSVRSSQIPRNFRASESEPTHGDPQGEPQNELYEEQEQDQSTENRLSPGRTSPLIILEHTPSHDGEPTGSGEVSQSREYLQMVGSGSGSVSDRSGQVYGSGHYYDRHLAVGSNSGHNHSGPRIRVDPHASHHIHSDGYGMVQAMEHLTVSDMPSPHGGGSSTGLSGGSRSGVISGRGHSPPQSPSHHLLPIHPDYGHYYYPAETPTTPPASQQQYMRMSGFSGISSLPQMHVAPPIVSSIQPIPVSYLTGIQPGSGRNLHSSICRFYAQGHCARGEQCNYAHVSSPKGGSRAAHAHQEGDDINCPTCRAQQKGGPAPGYPKSKDRHKQKNTRYAQLHNKKTTGQARYPQGSVHVHSHPPSSYSHSPHPTLHLQEGVNPHQHTLIHPVHSLGPPPPRHIGHRGSPVSGPVSKFSANSSIEQLEGNIYVIAKDQYGCRLLQRMLDERKAKVVDITFREVFEHINELMTDPFGNYLCQKLIEHCTDPHRLAIIQKVSPDLVAISLNMHGTRAVQKLVETISTPKEVELVVGALRQSVVTLIKELNGNHVIQRCLHHLSSKDNQFIFDAVARHCVSVATHKHGCCVLQRCIDYATVTQKRQLVQEIVSNALELVQDAFGNYVVQYVLDLGEPPLSHGIMGNLLGNISSLSVQKFSSNVVEKCMELADDEMRGRLVEELVNVERLPRLLQDPYANYVIQKALQISKKAQFERLVAVIKPHLSALRNTSFGKRIQSKIMKKFPDLSPVLDHSVRSPHQTHPHSPPPMHSIISHPQRLSSHQDQGSSPLLGSESRDPRASYTSPSKVSSTEFQPVESDDVSQEDPTNPENGRASNSRAASGVGSTSVLLTSDPPTLEQKHEVSDTQIPSEGGLDPTTSLRSSSSSASWLWSQSSDPSTHAASPNPSGLL